MNSRTLRTVLGALALVLAGLVWAWPLWAMADEQILDFDSRIEVFADGGLRVRETIVVTSANRKIRRGIYRDFPTDYRDRFGNKIRVRFKVVSAESDGQPEPFVVLPLSNGQRVRIGDKDVTLAPGTHTYTLVYLTDRQLGFFEDYDELYWNVTGNGWDFVIQRARAKVTLPPGTDILRHAAYTGPMGAVGQDFEALTDAQGAMTFLTTRALNPGWGLTIAVAWPKGTVAAPSGLDRIGWFLSDNRAAAAAGGGLLIVLVYYLIAWNRVGRDPPTGTIIARFEPPRQLSAAAMRCIYRMGFAGMGSKTLAVTLVQMAVKGYLTIEQDGKNSYRLHKTAKDESRLSGWEVRLARRLFSTRNTIALDRKNHRTIGEARKLMRDGLNQELGIRFFFHNRGYFAFGLALTLGIGLIVVTMGITPAAGAVLALATVVNFVFLPLLKAPTLAGRRLMDEIEGFHRYLAVAEQDRLDRLNPPQKTPELFERYLPYAMALDVENQWGEQFAGILNVEAPGRQTGYRPGWYDGLEPAGTLGSRLGQSFSKAISSAATAPGSQSGSSGGGGGSSGGGGGGGGGGGW